jgi:uncharacterized membrane protein
MDADLNALFAATLLFVGGHFALSSDALRPRLIDLVGEGAFRAVYSVAILAAFFAMLSAYGNAPRAAVWSPPGAFALIPLLVMPIALVLAVCGLSTPNPTLVGGERVLDERPASPAIGILTITRHPFLWGVALWAVSHLCVRGDAATIMLMGGILILSLGGMWHIDKRREAALGSAWGPMAMSTSLVPFAAVIQGRSKIDWAGIGLWRPLAGLALYALMLPAHEWVIGVRLLPS